MRAIGLALLSVVIATPLAFIAHIVLPHANLSLVFLTSVLITATLAGLEAALYAGLLAFLSFNFFFTQPYYSFRVEDDGDFATLFFFLIMATLTGKLAARMQEQMAQNRDTLQHLISLNRFFALMAAAPDIDTVQNHLAEYLASRYQHPCWVVLELEGQERLVGHDGHGASETAPPALPSVAAAERGEGIVPDGHRFILQCRSGTIGYVLLQGSDYEPAQLELARMICDIAASTLERTRLVAELEQTRLVSESEQLRSALLSSVSHDLRTPLASIIGASSSLLEYGGNLSEGDRRELRQTVLDEANRLNRYIQNLLDMTRLGDGKLTPKCDWVDINDVISSAIERLATPLAPLTVELEIAADMPLLYVQGVLIEQALVNVLDNAASFSPEQGMITILASHSAQRVSIRVCDQGPGIPPAVREKVFDMFYTMRSGDRKHRGSGLGLAICRGLIHAHGGEVTAEEGLDGHGTCIHIALPATQPTGEESDG